MPRYNRFLLPRYVPQLRAVLLYNLNFSNKPNDHDPEVKLRIMKMIMVLVGIISPEVGIIYYWRGQEHN